MPAILEKLRSSSKSTERKRREIVSRVLFEQHAAELEKAVEGAVAGLIKKQLKSAAALLRQSSSQKHASHDQSTHGRGGGGAYKFKIKDDDLGGVKKLSKKFFGTEELDTMAKVTGAPPGAEVAGYSSRGELIIWWKNDDGRAKRTISKNDEGDLEIENASFDVEKSKRGQGIGTKIFNDQVQAAAEAGVSKIKTTAAGNTSGDTGMNGYYTWPRLGYDTRISNALNLLPSKKKKEAKDKFPDAKNISDLMKTSSGRSWWKRNGVSIQGMEFDLTENSQSRRVLDAYVKEKFGSGKSTGDDARGRKDLGQDLGQDRRREKSQGQLIFDPKDWDDELFDVLVPVFARSVGAMMVSELGFMGVDVERLKSRTALIQKSTASEWLAGATDELLPGMVMGDVSMGFLLEYPVWMQDAVEIHLKDTFSQPYWAEVNRTTLGDIDKFIVQGTREGWSIEKIAKEMADDLGGGDYAKTRGKLIARTESTHALNGARSMAIDGTIAQFAGTEIADLIKKVWLSVLGTTTRDSHAILDGVPADKDGLWELAGVRVRWPGDVNLPVSERANCQCTINSLMGMTDAEAMQMVQQYQDRLVEVSKSTVRFLTKMKERRQWQTFTMIG